MRCVFELPGYGTNQNNQDTSALATKFVSGETTLGELRLESPAAPSPALRRRSNEGGLQIFDNGDVGTCDMDGNGARWEAAT